jgi:hypothetical protein
VQKNDTSGIFWISANEFFDNNPIMAANGGQPTSVAEAALVLKARLGHSSSLEGTFLEELSFYEIDFLSFVLSTQKIVEFYS